MRFITEMELRCLYKKEPFTVYTLAADTKITPEARQFLADKKIKLTQAQPNAKPKAAAGQPRELENRSLLKLRGKMAYIESLFFLAGAELLDRDAALAEEIIKLGKHFCDLQKAEREQTIPAEIEFWDWTETKINDFAANRGICFDIGEFHIRLENGKEIALLNHLRAALGELEFAISETYWDEEKRECSRQDLVDKLKLIIKILCIMMCKLLGGKKCKT